MRAKQFLSGRRSVDRFTWLGYLAIQSFLVDACVLRDYLAEYRALILSQGGQHSFRTKVTRIGSLKKQYLDKVIPTLPVDQALAGAAAIGCWLHLLGSYRDLVVHFAPLARAGKALYAVCTSLRIDAMATLPSIKLPIPLEPAKISESRTSGAYWNDPEQNYARFLNALENPAAAIDGLDYAHSSLGHLVVLASQLADISPVEPQIPTLTEQDILSLEVSNGGGDHKASGPPNGALEPK